MVICGMYPYYGYYNNAAMGMYYGSAILNSVVNAFSPIFTGRRGNSSNSVYTSFYANRDNSSTSGSFRQNCFDTRLGNLITGINNSTGYYQGYYVGEQEQMPSMPSFSETSWDNGYMQQQKPTPGELATYVGLMLSAPQAAWRGDPAKNPPYGRDLNTLPTITENGYGPSAKELAFMNWYTTHGRGAAQTNSSGRTQQRSTPETGNSGKTNPSNNSGSTGVGKTNTSNNSGSTGAGKTNTSNNTGSTGSGKTNNSTSNNNYNMTNTVMPDNGNEKLNNLITKRVEKAKSVTEYDTYINKYAKMYGVDPLLVKSVISQESNWKTDAGSEKGAQGLMQLMPRTATKYGCTDRTDPEQNIKAGVQYLAYLLERYDNNAQCALAAYNGGPYNVDDILNGTNNYGNNPNKVKDPSGIPRFKETQNFVYIVLGIYNQLIS